MAESRTELKQRLQAAGVWKGYVDMREELKDGGMEPAEASAEALRRVEARLAEQPNGEPKPGKFTLTVADEGELEIAKEAVARFREFLKTGSPQQATAPETERDMGTEEVLALIKRLEDEYDEKEKQQGKPGREKPDLGTERCLKLAKKWLEERRHGTKGTERTQPDPDLGTERTQEVIQRLIDEANRAAESGGKKGRA